MTKIAIERDDGTVTELAPSEYHLTYIGTAWTLTAEGHELVVQKKSQAHVLISGRSRCEMESQLDKWSKGGWKLVGPVQFDDDELHATMVKE